MGCYSVYQASTHWFMLPCSWNRKCSANWKKLDTTEHAPLFSGSPQPPLVLGLFLPPLPQISLSLEGWGVIYSLGLDVHSLFSLHLDQWRGFCVHWPLLQEVSLMRAERCPPFCVSELLLAVVIRFIKIGICTEQLL